MRYVWVLLLAPVMWAQTALVVPLSAVDAANVKLAHQQMLDAEKHWKDIQREISLWYLIVDKDDPDAGDRHWYPEDKSSGITSWKGIDGLVIQSTYDYKCETAEDKQARLAGEEKYREEEKRRDEEREAKSKRYRKGWDVRDCANCDPIPFEFSSDFKFITPKTAAPAEPRKFKWYSPIGTPDAIQW